MSEENIPINEAFRQALLKEDDLGKVIRAHIYIEHAVDELIALRIERPKYYEEARPNYNQRIHLAAALGVMRANLLPPLMRLGKLRNKFAHDPNAKITREDETEFLNSFSALDMGVLKGAYERHRNKVSLDLQEDFRKSKTPFRFIIAAIILNASLIHCRMLVANAGPGFVIE